MTNAPIFLTLAQVRFNPVLRMEDSISILQEHWRKIGYADFSKEEIKSIQINTDGQTPQVELTPAIRWRFANSKRNAEFLLFTDRLIFQTTAYETSDKFIENILLGVQLVHDAVSLAYIEGVSLRTLDAVIPSSGAKLSHYLHPQLLGFYGLGSGTFQQSYLQALSDFGEGKQLITKVVVLHGKLGISIDLLPMTLVIADRFTKHDGDHAILDNDCVVQGRFDWDSHIIHQKLREAKSKVTEAFKTAVTFEAIEEWK